MQTWATDFYAATANVQTNMQAIENALRTLRSGFSAQSMVARRPPAQ